jgi:hypothetical protein
MAAEMGLAAEGVVAVEMESVVRRNIGLITF